MKEEANKIPVVDKVETTEQAVKDGLINKILEETEKLKLKFSAKVNVLIEDKDLREKLYEVIGEAVDESMILGQIKGAPDDVVKSVTDTFENVAKNFGCLSDTIRAETYKKLFHNQRIITAHLMSASQLLQLQIGDTESMIAPNPLSMFERNSN